ncbi:MULTISPECIES: L-threonylcarbamoyladenylate synthase [unclassified Shewanella]|uniref:L-threonylcarbamoyladenylate synthase n=1 Tax=unclassified Shewanella TaxID=196818 RepID=UPI0009706B32|nr:MULTISPECIES: L-threonylcarbamoyladenylate synthase [unclassified Shewanella]MDO6617768.1 L-threonylcarbamoyladenylate synthase [Shewanella sp. 6_MG-2023]MDO6639065.1 L-threonylcarbamoyladenylate synthase [Shewanella sp. 5_MG-2023]MDO6677599.1 L-threonylcarbamoyladenylate synthase [Shewanella sp. 4_MG-2023]MDO6777143.1 L-threonylcarbamoyladenylate synthase [Shewanella sp. 3_MG-2023]PMG28073.1 threonylcarbamoyl-AMP synthase [Shewanella sp. 10N.286.52.C2]
MSQFFYIHDENPQARLISQAVNILKQGGVIVYPTDSGYALGCMIGEKDAMTRMARIRKIDNDNNFSLMCRDLSELANFARVDNQAYRLLKSCTPGPYTFIFKASKEVPRRLQCDKKKTIGIRVPNNLIALALLEALEAPIMSTSLVMPDAEFAESDPEHIRDILEHNVDAIIHGGYLAENQTTVIDMSEGDIDIIRQGAGDTSIFE